jgi:hypothetical protein
MKGTIIFLIIVLTALVCHIILGYNLNDSSSGFKTQLGLLVGSGVGIVLASAGMLILKRKSKTIKSEEVKEQEIILTRRDETPLDETPRDETPPPLPPRDNEN